jgi:hypothetical protein
VSVAGVGEARKENNNAKEIRLMQSSHRHQASQEVARALIASTPRPCSPALSVTILPYKTTVS